MDLNKVMIIGRLTRDPEVRTTPGGANVVSFSVATGFTWTDQSGQKKEQTEFHNVVAWRKLADIIGQYLKKGSQVYIEGRLQTRNYEKDGQKHYRTEIVADNMIMLGSRSGGSAGSPAPAASETPAMIQPEPPAETPSIQIDDADMPF
ncbi:MAG: single-stranded DNA-binding protein [Candidatus Saccharibacteria bacterium]